MIHYYLIVDRVHEAAGHIAAGVSIISAVLSFLAVATPLLQFIAAIVAVISGILSIIWLSMKIHIQAVKNRDEEEEE